MRGVPSLQASRHNVKSTGSGFVLHVVFPAERPASPRKIGNAKRQIKKQNLGFALLAVLFFTFGWLGTVMAETEQNCLRPRIFGV